MFPGPHKPPQKGRQAEHGPDNGGQQTAHSLKNISNMHVLEHLEDLNMFSKVPVQRFFSSTGLSHLWEELCHVGKVS